MNVDKYRKILDKLVKKSFPSLKNEEIWICESGRKKFKSASADTYYFILFWRVRLGKKLSGLPKEFVKAILAHELSHIEIFQKRSFVKRIISSFKCRFSKSFREDEERNTDRLVVEKGYGKELYSFRKYNLSVADKKTKLKIKKYYLSPKEIKYYTKKCKK